MFYLPIMCVVLAIALDDLYIYAGWNDGKLIVIQKRIDEDFQQLPRILKSPNSWVDSHR